MDLTVLVGAAATAALTGIFPWMAAEVVVAGAAVLLPTEALPVLTLVCAASQMGGKSVVYALARWSPQRLPRKARDQMWRAEAIQGHPRWVALTVLASALFSIPPFFIATIACGAMRIPYPLYLGVGFAGNVVRYGVVTLAAQAVVGG